MPSIHEHGRWETVLGRPLAHENDELVAGERRDRAVQAFTWPDIPVVLREFMTTGAESQRHKK